MASMLFGLSCHREHDGAEFTEATNEDTRPRGSTSGSGRRRSLLRRRDTYHAHRSGSQRRSGILLLWITDTVRRRGEITRALFQRSDRGSSTYGDFPERVRRASVAPRFLDVWGIAPVLGRGFTDAEHYAGGPSAVLISDRYWRRRFGADPHVMNRTVRLESESFPIVGGMPASFHFPDREVDLWLPVQRGDKLAQVRYAVWYTGVGRLKPAVTFEQARANLNAIQTELGKQYPKTDAAISVEVVPLKEHTVSGIRSSLWLLFGGSPYCC